MNTAAVTPQTRLRDLTEEEFVALLGERTSPRRFVTGLRDIAEYLGVSKDTVRRWCARGAMNGALYNEGGIIMLDTYKL